MAPVIIHPGLKSWDSNSRIGGAIDLTFVSVPLLCVAFNSLNRLHSSDKEVLADLIECAKERYGEQGTSRVTVHLSSSVRALLHYTLL
jgi:hypothetical protein